MVYSEFGLSEREKTTSHRRRGSICTELFMVKESWWGFSMISTYEFVITAVIRGHWAVRITYRNYLPWMQGCCASSTWERGLVWLQAEISVVVTGNFWLVIKLRILNHRWHRRVMSPEREVWRPAPADTGTPLRHTYAGRWYHHVCTLSINTIQHRDQSAKIRGVYISTQKYKYSVITDCDIILHKYYITR